MSSYLIEVSKQLSHNTKTNLTMADFCSGKQVMQLLTNIGVVPINEHPTIVYESYNWHFQLNKCINLKTHG